MNTEKVTRLFKPLLRYRIFKLLGCWPPRSWISLDPKFVTDQTVARAASPCQISFKSLKLWPRYGDLSIFQYGGRRHFGFLKFQIFNGRDAQEG